MGKRYETHVHRGDHYCERKQLYHDSRISEMLLKKIKKREHLSLDPTDEMELVTVSE